MALLNDIFLKKYSLHATRKAGRERDFKVVIFICMFMCVSADTPPYMSFTPEEHLSSCVHWKRHFKATWIGYETRQKEGFCNMAV